MSSSFYPGKRLSFDGHLCTARYVGPVNGTKGDWLGVEWDETWRGKHDGRRDGTRYFECENASRTGINVSKADAE
jgi:tubulin-specific chaperone E